MSMTVCGVATVGAIRHGDGRTRLPAGGQGWSGGIIERYLAGGSASGNHGTVLTIVDVDARRWDDLAELMGERGDPSRCWCQYYRSGGRYEHDGREPNRAAMRRQVTTALVPQGVLAYQDGRPVGWCAVAPRGEYPRLKRMRAARMTTDEDGLWSVTCFVVRVGHRRRGVASTLLDAAVDLARRYGARIVEAYPVDPSRRPTGSSGLFQGPLPMYLRAGFVEVARPSPSRSVVRLALTTSPAG